MIHVRVVVTDDLLAGALRHLEDHAAVCHIALLRDAVRQPDGHLVLFDVAPEAADAVLDALAGLGLVEHGSIAIEHDDLNLSNRSKAIRAAAPGDHTDAVVWAEVAETVEAEASPSASYLTYFVISAVIAAAGILTDSPILIVGAMVVGPDYGPVAALSYGIARRRFDLVGRGLTTFAGGAALGAVAAGLTALVARLLGQVPATYLLDSRPLTGFISRPDFYTVVVAAAAAVAGVFALTHAKAGTLVGVLISVTTVPAIADIGVAAAFGRGQEMAGAITQLALNVGCLIVVGVATIAILHRRRR